MEQLLTKCPGVPTTRLKGAIGGVAMHFLFMMIHWHIWACASCVIHTLKDNACRGITSVVDGVVSLEVWVQSSCRDQLIPYKLEGSVMWSCPNPHFSRLKSYLKYFYLDCDYYSLFSKNLASPFLV